MTLCAGGGIHWRAFGLAAGSDDVGSLVWDNGPLYFIQVSLLFRTGPVLAGRPGTPICGVALIPPAFGGAGSVTAAYGVRLIPQDSCALHMGIPEHPASPCFPRDSPGAVGGFWCEPPLGTSVSERSSEGF